MDQWKSRLSQVGGVLGAALGGLIAVGIIGGILFARYGLPFLRDNSATFHCDSAEIDGACDQFGTLPHFFAQMCGRGEVSFDGDIGETINIFGDPGAQEPDTISFAYQCGDTTYLRVETESNNPLEEFDQVRAAVVGDQGDRVLEIFDAWLDGDIETDEARRQLLSVG